MIGDEGQGREHLAEADRHIAEGQQRIAEQEARIAELQRDGHPTAEAVEMLHKFKDTLRLMEEHRQIILKGT
jgi:hypothetical protein